MNNSSAFKFLFGPVYSGRLGISLGLDLLGAKICSLDCLYCEAGPTRQLTLDRRPYVPVGLILEELRAYQAAGQPRPQHITLGGLGEPCLNSDLAAIIVGAKKVYPNVPVAVLTNSTLLSDPQVRRDLMAADVVLPSLDTLVPSEFKELSQPHPELDLADITAGLEQFAAKFTGILRLEVLLSKGLNDSEENLRLLREFIIKLKPSQVDVTTVSRPGASGRAQAVSPETMAAWRQVLNIGADQTRRPASGQAGPVPESAIPLEKTIFQSLRRRPQTAAQLALALGCPQALVDQALLNLARTGRTRPDQGDANFYRIAGQSDDSEQTS